MRQSLQAVVGGYCLPGASPAPVTIEPRAAAVDDTIEVSGRTYIMTEMEVPGFQTDEVYIVTFPTYVQTISDRIVIISVLVTFWERRGNAEDFLPCYSFVSEIDGRPAGFDETSYATDIFTQTMPDSGTYQVSYTTSIAGVIVIDSETLSAFGYSYSQTSEVVAAEIDNLVDRIPLFPDPVALRAQRVELIEELRRLLGYIRIRKKE